MAVETQMGRGCSQEIIEPMPGKILGEVIGGRRLSPGGLILISLRSKNAPELKMRVTAIGKEGKEKKGKKWVTTRTPVKVGDIVSVKPMTAQKFRAYDKDMAIIKFGDVIAGEP